MPVSSVSYFPAQRATDRIVGLNAGLRQTGDRVFLAGLNAGSDSTAADLIVIGSSACDAGLLVGAGEADGTIVIGSNALGAQSAQAGANLGANIVIGLRALEALAGGGQNIVIGTRAMQNAINTATGQHASNVVIGFEALQFQNSSGPASTAQTSSSVIIGARACRLGALADSAFLSCVIIGARACDAFAGVQMNQSVVIGTQAARNATHNGTGNNVIIGHGACDALTNGINNVVIGQGTNLSSGGSNVLIGSASSLSTGSENTVIGAACLTLASGSRNIVLGSQAGNGENPANSDRLIIETFDGVTRRALLYGDLSIGNLIVGRSAPGVDRAFGVGPTNILKLLNGTIGDATTRTGGGYFYVTGGVLHFVQSDGTDNTVQIGSAAGQLLRSNVALANGAGIAAGTLGNAPAVGNPTKWLAIDDNGTVRQIPAW